MLIMTWSDRAGESSTWASTAGLPFAEDPDD
jgi:hypothetical protein